METVLVIDDEKATLAMFRLLLDALGYEVLTAENGPEGLALFARERPGIVLTDIKMPGMDGIAVLKHIKEIAPQTEVIVITGHGDMDLAIKALNLDATDFINKPIQRQLLEQSLTRAKGRRKLALEHAESMTLEHHDGKSVIKIRGQINALSETRIQTLFDEACRLAPQRIVLLFDPQAAVNGAGIAVLTQIMRTCREEGRELVIAGLSENLSKIFEIVGLTQKVPVFGTLEEALL